MIVSGGVLLRIYEAAGGQARRPATRSGASSAMTGPPAPTSWSTLNTRLEGSWARRLSDQWEHP